MRQIDYSAFLLCLFILAVNFAAYVFVMPWMYNAAADDSTVRAMSWSFAYASTLILSPFILIIGVIFPGILRTPKQDEQNG